MWYSPPICSMCAWNFFCAADCTPVGVLVSTHITRSTNMGKRPGSLRVWCITRVSLAPAICPVAAIPGRRLFGIERIILRGLWCARQYVFRNHMTFSCCIRPSASSSIEKIYASVLRRVLLGKGDHPSWLFSYRAYITFAILTV